MIKSIICSPKELSEAIAKLPSPGLISVTEQGTILMINIVNSEGQRVELGSYLYKALTEDHREVTVT